MKGGWCVEDAVLSRDDDVLRREVDVLRREDGHTLRKVLEIEVEGQSKNGVREGHRRER